MSPTKEHQSNEDLKTFKEEVIQQFHIISENVIDQVKQVAEGVRNVDEKLERFRKEIKAEAAENHATLSLAIKKVDGKIDNTRQELKAEIQGVRTELKAEIQGVRDDFSDKLGKIQTELKSEIQELRTELKEEIQGARTELKAEIQGIRTELKTEIQETRQEILAAVKFSYAELDKRLTTLEKEFLELKHRVDKIEGRSIS